MVKTKDDILSTISAVLGENNSEDAITLLEDITDTLDDYETRTKDSTAWKQKYEENDRAWRQKYKDRFFEKESEDESINTYDDEEKLTYESLFVTETR